jgi:hypothetical protein
MSQSNGVVHYPVAEVLEVEALQAEAASATPLHNSQSEAQRPSPLAEHFATVPTHGAVEDDPAKAKAAAAAAEAPKSDRKWFSFMSANCDRNVAIFSKDCTGGFLHFGSSNCSGCGVAIFSRDCNDCWLSVFSNGSKDCGISVFDAFSESCGLSVFGRRNNRVGLAVFSNECEMSGLTAYSNKTSRGNFGVFDNGSSNCGLSVMTAKNKGVTFGFMSGHADEHAVSMFGWKKKMAVCFGNNKNRKEPVAEPNNQMHPSGAPYVAQ